MLPIQLKVSRFICGVLGLRDLPSATMIIAHEQAQRKRYAEILAAIKAQTDRTAELCTKLDRIETMLITAHAFERPHPKPIPMDWEQVQAEALAEMLANPPKEYTDGTI